ncbi:MAG: SsrA-binding protein SmpB [Clostridia bacterium]|nr:SsrA-binding protein SmpB [Clostridia bacterium]
MEEKIICLNRSASHEYFILERLEAGIVLEGAEVKSIRSGNCQLKDSFCVIEQGELFIKNMHIAVYDKSGAFNTRDSRRSRKLLIHKKEMAKLYSKVTQKGLTLIPLKMYFKQALIKVELGLCQGKHTYDKKRSQMEKDLMREKERVIKNYK